ncbi:hypothetical protein LI82_12310 [Methanococcoides methylutens]|uniref:Uncharacterized protein n=1 Tax=Methanococcoides methylutens TaxID=2226 RepID=A0A099T2R4_METMT|nr:hypothetical protein [Methanococcoides methylutens]KGK98473.1 hypothetical protein LI82_12310 [Methanococcoides methylutens]
MNNKNTGRYVIIVIGIFSLVVIGALLLDNTSQTELPNNDGAVTIESSGLQEEISYEEMAERSNLIIIGTVKEIEPSKWNTPDGKRPGELIEDFKSSDEIYTDVIVTVDDTLKNSHNSKEIVVRLRGGTVGEDTMIIEDIPSFKSGEKVLLYLIEDTYPHTKAIGPEHYVVIGYGKFTLTDDGKAIGVRKSVDLEELLSTINVT